MKYSDEFDRLLVLLIKENDRLVYKGVNYTDTYTRKHLLAFADRVIDRTMYNHCIEDRLAMHQVDDLYREWLQKQEKEDAEIDKLAEQNAEYKDSLFKPYKDK